MKKIILYIDSMCRGGAQRVMKNLADYFIQMGIAVTLVNDFIPDASQPQYMIAAKVKRVYLRQNVDGNTIIKNIERIWKLRGIIRDEKADLVLSFLGYPNQRMLLATLGLPVKKVVSVRNDPNKEYADKGIKKVIAKALFKLADGCVFQTNEAALYFSKSIRKKAIIIANPVAEQFFQTPRHYNPCNIVSVGRLEPQKNHHLIIEAFSKIAAEYPNEKMILYGEGSLRTQIVKQIEDLNLKDRVLLPGDVSEINHALAQSKIFVLSSDFEGMPNALMEAMAMGIPCISTDCPCGGPKEIIDNWQDGVLVPCRNVHEMADAMRRLLDNAELRNCLAENAKKKAMRFMPEIINTKWIEYLNVIGKDNVK